MIDSIEKKKEHKRIAIVTELTKQVNNDIKKASQQYLN